VHEESLAEKRRGIQRENEIFKTKVQKYQSDREEAKRQDYQKYQESEKQKERRLRQTYNHMHKLWMDYKSKKKEEQDIMSNRIADTEGARNHQKLEL
jgi:hypothetical protein